MVILRSTMRSRTGRWTPTPEHLPQEGRSHADVVGPARPSYYACPACLGRTTLGYEPPLLPSSQHVRLVAPTLTHVTRDPRDREVSSTRAARTGLTLHQAVLRDSIDWISRHRRTERPIAMLDILLWVTKWLLVPVILSSGLAFAGLLAFDTGHSREQSVSAKAGLLAGLVVATGFAVSQFGRLQTASSTDAQFEFSIVAALIGFAAGFCLFWLPLLFSDQLTGFLTLLLSASSAVAVFLHFFDNGARSFTMTLAIAAILGFLIHLVIFPHRITASGPQGSP